MSLEVLYYPMHRSVQHIEDVAVAEPGPPQVVSNPGAQRLGTFNQANGRRQLNWLASRSQCLHAAMQSRQKCITSKLRVYIKWISLDEAEKAIRNAVLLSLPKKIISILTGLFFGKIIVLSKLFALMNW